jgi:hypothetical protein
VEAAHKGFLKKGGKAAIAHTDFYLKDLIEASLALGSDLPFRVKNNRVP